MSRAFAPRFNWPPTLPRSRRLQTLARDPSEAGERADRAAAAVFARNAPLGARGTPTVAATGRAALATVTVLYDGVAPSNFGSALGYGAFRVSASATSRALVADAQTAAP